MAPICPQIDQRKEGKGLRDVGQSAFNSTCGRGGPFRISSPTTGKPVVGASGMLQQKSLLHPFYAFTMQLIPIQIMTFQTTINATT